MSALFPLHHHITYQWSTPPTSHACLLELVLEERDPHNARNAWWRLLINKLPSGYALHSFIPGEYSFFPGEYSRVCRICQTHVDTSRHLLFSCPKKLEVWQGSLSRYVEERGWSADYVCSLFFPDPDPIKPHDDIPVFLLLGAILATIWRYHFAFVIEGQAFEPRIVLASVDLAISQARAQLAEKRQREKHHAPPSVEEPRPTPTTLPNRSVFYSVF